MASNKAGMWLLIIANNVFYTWEDTICCNHLYVWFRSYLETKHKPVFTLFNIAFGRFKSWLDTIFKFSHFPSGIRINPGEKTHISLKSIPFKIEDSGGCSFISYWLQDELFADGFVFLPISGEVNNNALAFSNIPLTNCEIDSCSSPCSDFYHRSKLRLEKLMADEPTPPQLLPNEEPPSAKTLDIGALKAALLVDITLIVLWKVG